MRSFAANVPLFVPAIVITILVAIAGSRVVGRDLGAPRWVAFLLIASVGLIAAATVTPLRSALDGVTAIEAVCDLHRFGPAGVWHGLYLTDAGLNVLLFIPLGVAVGLLPRSRRAAAVLAAAALSPVLIEVIQLLVRPLGRSCQSGDVVDNLTGLAAGLLVGLLGARSLARLRR